MHRARQFQRADFDRQDLIIALDEDNARHLHRLAPNADAAAKIRLLRSFDPQADGDLAVPDPYYGTDHDFEHLAPSDQMIARTRRRLVHAARALRDKGTVPPGVDNPEVYLQARSGDAIGIIVPDLTNPFYAQLAIGVERSAAAMGFAVLAAHTECVAATELAAAHALIERRVGGAVIGGMSLNSPLPKLLMDHDIPVTLAALGEIDDARPAGEQSNQRQFERISEPPERRLCELRVGHLLARQQLHRMPHDRGGARMRVLHIEDRVVLRLLGDFGEIEFERLVVLARQHDEAEDVLAVPAGQLVELIGDVAQGDQWLAHVRSPSTRAARGA